MKKIVMFVVIGVLCAGAAHGARLEDVSVLGLSYKKDSFQVKMRGNKDPKDSFFYVDIAKDDEDSFKKIALVLKKFKTKESFKLMLDIRSFSPFPSGSNYKSDSVTFVGDVESEAVLP